jgi:hypothetical protein
MRIDQESSTHMHRLQVLQPSAAVAERLDRKA